MKRSLFIAIVVLLMAALFVSCNAEKSMEDQLVEVTIDGGSRALSAVTSATDATSPANLYWYYTAHKSAGVFKIGEKTEKTLIIGDGADGQGIAGASLGKFSKGTWEFGFWGYTEKLTEQNAATLKPVYFQAKQEATLDDVSVRISVNMELGDGLPEGIIAFDNGLQFKYTNPNGTDIAENEVDLTAVLSLKVKIDGATAYYKVDETNDWVATSGNGSLSGADYVATFAQPATGEKNLKDISLEAGEHDLEFIVLDADGEELGSYEITVVVTNGSKTVITGSVDDNDAAELIIGDVSATAVTAGFTSVAAEANTITTSVAPTEAKTTSVSFPAGSIEEGDHTLSLEVYNAESAVSTFQITDSNGVVAGISLNLDNATNGTTFSGNEPVAVTTYVAKGLVNPVVKYVGDNNEYDSVYDPATGKLTFYTNHFSSFYIKTDSVAMNATTSVAYDSLQGAIDSAKAGETIELFTDVSTSAIIEVVRSIEINGNGHTITSTATRGLWIDADNVSLVLRNLTIDGKNICQRGVQVNAPDENIFFHANVTIENCVIKNITYYAINLCSKTTVNLTVKDSEVSGWAAINAYGTGNVILVDNSVLRGINDKGYNAEGWNDFATICLEGDTTGLTDNHSADYIITVRNSTISATQTTGNHQTAVGFNNNATNSSIDFINCTFDVGEGCYFAYDVSGDTTTNTIKINGVALDYPTNAYFNLTD